MGRAKKKHKYTRAPLMAHRPLPRRMRIWRKKMSEIQRTLRHIHRRPGISTQNILNDTERMAEGSVATIYENTD